MTRDCAGCTVSDSLYLGEPYLKTYFKGFIKFSDEFNYWSHLCTAVDMETGFVSIVRDGRVHWNAVIEEFKNITLKPKSLAGNVNLGLYFFKAHQWSRNIKIGNLNIFARKMTLEDLADITRGSRCGEEGDYIAWSKSKWFYSGNYIKEVEVEKDELCSQYPKSSIYVTPSESWVNGVHTCKRLGNNAVHVPRDNEHAVKVFNFYMQIAYKNVSGKLEKYNDLETRYRIGAKLAPDTNRFININTNEPLEYFRWKSGYNVTEQVQRYKTKDRPAGLSVEWNWDSANLLPVNEWVITSMDSYSSRSGICENQGKPVFEMRGVPSKCTRIKDLFTPSNIGQKNGLIGYVGYRSNEIGYNRDLQQWELFSYEKVKPKPWGISKASIRSLLLGVQDWTLYNMTKLCTSDFEFHLKIDLNNCTKSQFNCDDGECIEMQKRCDGRVNCVDESDEIECKIIIESSSYDKEITPLPEDIEKKAEIRVSVVIKKILEINEIDQKFHVGYELALRWKDRRLKYHNLKRNPNLNFLSKAERLSVWTPSIVLSNTKSEEIIAKDDKTIIKVIANKNFSHDTSDSTVLKNIYIFNGDINDIEMTKILETAYICTYNMGLYPFDTQTCSMDLLPTTNLEDFCFLKSGLFNYTGPNELTQYFLKKSFMRNTVISGRNGVSIFIILGRRLLSNILTIYLPTVLLNLIGHLTTYFKPYFFEVNLISSFTVLSFFNF